MLVMAGFGQHLTGHRRLVNARWSPGVPTCSSADSLVTEGCAQGCSHRCAEAAWHEGPKSGPYHRAMSPQGSDTRSAGREGSRVPSATRGERQRESRRQQRRRLLPCWWWAQRSCSSSVAWWRGAFAVPPPPPRRRHAPLDESSTPRRPRPPISHRPSRPRSLLLSLEKGTGPWPILGAQAHRPS